MGYRVGSMCFQTEAEAADYKMSLVVPTVAADGSLKLPVRKADGWYYGGTTVTKPRPYPYPGNQTVTVQNKVILSEPHQYKYPFPTKINGTKWDKTKPIGIQN